MTVHEQRTHSRIKISLPCEIRSGEVSAPGRLIEVSVSGSLVSTNCTLRKGDPISISVVLPDSKQSLSLHGRIARMIQYSYRKEAHCLAVRFHGVTPDSMLLVKTAMSMRGATV